MSGAERSEALAHLAPTERRQYESAVRVLGKPAGQAVRAILRTVSHLRGQLAAVRRERDDYAEGRVSLEMDVARATLVRNLIRAAAVALIEKIDAGRADAARLGADDLLRAVDAELGALRKAVG